MGKEGRQRKFSWLHERGPGRVFNKNATYPSTTQLETLWFFQCKHEVVKRDRNITSTAKYSIIDHLEVNDVSLELKITSNYEKKKFLNRKRTKECHKLENGLTSVSGSGVDV